jgi:hypothetical protein
MNDSPSEAVAVAVMALIVFYFMAGGWAEFPKKVSLRWLLIGMTTIAVVLGTIAFLARIKT